MAALDNESPGGRVGDPGSETPQGGWEEKYPHLGGNEPPPSTPTNSGVGMPNINMEDAVAVVKEKLWFVGDAAMKSVAEVLYGFGISPTVLGYSEEELLEDDEYMLDPYQQPHQKDEVVQKSSFAMRSEEKLQRRKADEGGPVPDESEDGGVQFLAPEDGAWRTGEEEEYVEFGEDKKDK